MPRQRQYKRILLKLSGEVLKGSAPLGVDPEAVLSVAGQIRKLVRAGVETAVVIGAGNLFRGLPASRRGMTRATADYMGMLATIMNSLALQDGLEACGVPTRIQSALPQAGVTEAFDRRLALEHLAAGQVVIFSGGTGHPFFTTDTTAALRACEIAAEAIFKATKVNGVFTADPVKHPDARRYCEISYGDALEQQLEIMDATAFSLCRENRIPIVVFNFFEKGSLGRVIRGDLAAATLVHGGATRLEDDPQNA